MGTRNTFSHVPFPSQLVLRARLRGWLRRGELCVGVMGNACQIVAGSSCKAKDWRCVEAKNATVLTESPSDDLAMVIFNKTPLMKHVKTLPLLAIKSFSCIDGM